MVVYEIYSMRVVNRNPTTGEDGSLAGMICIEEVISSIDTSVPEYIGRLDSYTEKDCRDICLQIAKCIEILHNAGIAHRNLHVENVLIDLFVSSDRLFPVRVESSLTALTQPVLLSISTGESYLERLSVRPTYQREQAADWSFWIPLQLVCIQSA
jgi:serine/threonine protein kinase